MAGFVAFHQDEIGPRSQFGQNGVQRRLFGTGTGYLQQSRGRQGHQPRPGLAVAPGVFAVIPQMLVMGVLQDRDPEPLGAEPLQQPADEFGFAGIGCPHNGNGFRPQCGGSGGSWRGRRRGIKVQERIVRGFFLF